MQNSNHENITNKNTQDIFLRNATLALLDVLNRRVIIDLVRDGNIEKHEIPFFYNFAGNQGFMQDFFIDIPDNCKYPEYAEGNYDIVPRGIVTLNNFSIKTGDITNKFVRGTFTQEERNENDQKVMKAYSSRLYSLPMNLKFDVKIKTDNLNKTFKITEKIFDFYYKNEVLYFQYRGIRIPGQIVFSDSITNDKKYNFTYSDDTYVNTSFSIDMETYYPSFDDSSTMYKGNTIKQWGSFTKLSGSNTNIGQDWIDTDFPKTE
jgi:hypothetical protein